MNRSPHPISQVCPACGSARHKKVDPDWQPAVVNDRICLDCNTRYSPPTPAVARIFAVVMGIAAIVWGCAYLYRYFFSKDRGGWVNPFWCALVILFGVAAIIMGFAKSRPDKHS